MPERGIKGRAYKKIFPVTEVKTQGEKRCSRDDVFTQGEKDFLNKVGQEERYFLWTWKIIGEMRSSKFTPRSSILRAMETMEKMDKPVLTSNEYERVVTEAAVIGIKLWPEFSENREKIFNKEVEFFSKALGGLLDKKMNEILDRVSVMKTLEMILDTDDKKRNYREEKSKVEKRLSKAVYKVKEQAFDTIEDLTIFEKIEKQR